MEYHFDWGILLESPYSGWLVTGIEITLLLAIASTILSFLLGAILTVGMVSDYRIMRFIAGTIIHVTRNIPGLFWILFFYFVFPEFLPEPMQMSINESSYYPIIAGILGLTVDNSPYIAEILRSGVNAVSAGQWDASVASGFTNFQKWIHVLLPQALRISIAPLGTRLIHNFKNTSLCMAIAVPELTWASKQVESLTFRGIESMTAATIFYLLMGLLLMVWVNRLDNRLAQKRP